MIDRIEEEVAKTVDHVDAGNKELVEASKKRRKVRKVGISFMTQVLLIFFIMFAVFN